MTVTTTGVPTPAAPADETAPAAEATAEALVESDLLVEDVSIDGMCGVY
jgi:mycofactocin precursor